MVTIDIPNFTNFKEYLQSCQDIDVKESSFKQHPVFNQILEHVSKQTGNEYLKEIEEQFSEIPFDEIRKFININDLYGSASKSIFTTSSMKLVYCSPSNLRYIYHSLVILKQIQSLPDTKNLKIVELGAGYGGLFLAINHFAKVLGLESRIEKYYMIDLPETSSLIQKYVSVHHNVVQFNYEVITNRVEDIYRVFQDYPNNDEIFFISNYCFSEISDKERQKYVDFVLPKVSYGFIVWQTCFGLDIENAATILRKDRVRYELETPQTASPHIRPNYFVYIG